MFPGPLLLPTRPPRLAPLPTARAHLISPSVILTHLTFFCTIVLPALPCLPAGELPKGDDGSYGTSVTWVKAMDPASDVILAYKQNGRLLTPDHGYPIRCQGRGPA